MYVLKLSDSEELSDMKAACSASILVDHVRCNKSGDIDSYKCGDDITFVRQNGREIGIICKVEVING